MSEVIIINGNVYELKQLAQVGTTLFIYSRGNKTFHFEGLRFPIVSYA